MYDFDELFPQNGLHCLKFYCYCYFLLLNFYHDKVVA